MPAIVPIYAAVFAILFVMLSLRVIGARRSTRIPIGVGGNIALERRIRVQGNFAEYVPLALILFVFIELQGWSHWLVHGLCLLLLAGRLLHAYGVSQEPEDFRIRVTAMAMTFTATLIAAVLLLLDGIA
jgi:uncharacterized membrane protein YecN with MAPEG domain